MGSLPSHKAGSCTNIGACGANVCHECGVIDLSIFVNLRAKVFKYLMN